MLERKLGVARRARTLAWAVGALAIGLVAVGGCSKKKDEDTKAKPEKTEAKKPPVDRYADGKRLENSLKDWTKRWADTADLPACDPLLTDAGELELCKGAQTALTNLKAAVAKPEPNEVLVRSAGDLALATEKATEKLRAASMAKQQKERAAAGPSASGKPASSAAPKAAASAIKPKLADTLRKGPAGSAKAEASSAPVDPAMQVMQAYSRTNRAAFRYMSQFLEFGPLPTRKMAFGEFERLSKEKQTWPALGRALREAAMAENDPQLQKQLKSLAPKSMRRPPMAGMPGKPGGAERPLPPPPAMPPGAELPPGHPTVPSDGAQR